ncbi:helix-turn-helix domain-containing protein [Streptomyces telluris]|uniref:Helix-turn-helix domain-containing protein n=1 Tax=Streptomyces telluris TaxID=2720021 RepID=A0A9X2LNV5_9ACTN|nr:helix-turn-helix domain-containing protein [Streptomyces telluris]MCQ8774414.1 helix-turn-helix domain-containing protein [Streptomyces telluris]NJP81639.1 helix-turn-helix domain-containing protein [Streptomyces telluris]
MRWRTLPESHSRAGKEFVAALREVKDRSGLSLTALASRTPYSRSTWERYLNGRTLPPVRAVEALARAVGVDAEPLLRLRTAAEPVWCAVEGGVRAAAGDGGPEQSAGHDGRKGDAINVPALAAAVTAVLVSAAVSVGLILVGPSGSPENATADQAVDRYSCRYVRQGGLMYAGNSTTVSQLLGVFSAGPAVAEMQCLLRRRGVDIGVIDGRFSESTARQVAREQRRGGIDGYGGVDAETWALLRHTS